jgi:hypothetical protein
MSRPNDRRTPSASDRRAKSRGGRRADDPHASSSPTHVQCPSCEGGIATLFGVSTTPGSLLLVYRCSVWEYQFRWNTADGPIPRGWL